MRSSDRARFAALLLAVATAAICRSAHAQHLGAIGPVYPIAEPSLLALIQSNLRELTANGGLERLQRESQARIRKQIERAIQGFKQLARFAPYVAGDTFTQADLSAFNSLGLVGMVTQKAYGVDLLAAAGVDYKPYLKRVGERASGQRIVADRKQAQLPKA